MAAPANGDRMPECGIVRDTWRLVEQQSVPIGRGAWSQVNNLGYPYWIRDIEYAFTSGQQGRLDFQETLAFYEARQGARFTFTGPRIFNRHPAAMGPMNDTSLTVTGVNIAGSWVSLGNAGAYTASYGDMISYYTQAGGYWIGRVTEGRQAVAGNVDLYVHPAPFTPHATLANPRRSNALGEFRVTSIDPQEGWKDFRLRVSAMQEVRG